MDNRIGRLAASSGVERAAAEQAVRNIELWPFDTRSTRRTRRSRHDCAGSLRGISATSTSFELSSVCVSVNPMTAARLRRLPAMARLLCAAVVRTDEANGLACGRTRESAAGEAAGAILGRSHQI